MPINNYKLLVITCDSATHSEKLSQILFYRYVNRRGY